MLQKRYTKESKPIFGRWASIRTAPERPRPAARELILACLLLALSLANLHAGPAIEREFRHFSGPKPVLLQELSSPPPSGQIGPFPTPLLQEALMRSYSRWSVDQIRLEVFETPDPAGAYQLFRLWPLLGGQDPLKLSDVSLNHQLVGERLLVWRGNFLLSLTGGPLSELVRTASRLSEAIRMENELPVTITHLPREGMITGSDQFYLGPEALALNPDFPEPLLMTIGLDDQIEVAAARYEPDGRFLFLIGYPTVDLARKHSVEIQDRLHDFFVDEGLYMKRSGLLIALYSGPWEQAESVLGAVQYRPRVEWIEERDPWEKRESEVRTFFGFLTTTFIGIGIALLFTIGAGIVVGLARYEVLRRFPNVGERQKMIRLKLDQSESRPGAAAESPSDFPSPT